MQMLYKKAVSNILHYRYLLFLVDCRSVSIANILNKLLILKIYKNKIN